MSDNWIALIPTDPYFVPPESKRFLAVQRFREIAPEADKIEVKLSEKPAFFDCGANFEEILCPRCSSKVELEWWQARMDDDFTEKGFRLYEYSLPCCKYNSTLNSLRYNWPQGFARFAVDAMNPRLGELPKELLVEFECILGTPLTVIYQHL